MLTEITTVLSRSADTLVEDAAGVVAVFAVLLGALALPGLF